MSRGLVSQEEVVGLLPLHPDGTNSTFFTVCCHAAICDDEARCPRCGRLVIGWDAGSAHERGKIRWKHAYQRPIVRSA